MNRKDGHPKNLNQLREIIQEKSTEMELTSMKKGIAFELIRLIQPGRGDREGRT